MSVVATSSVGGEAHLLGNRAEAVAGVARFDALVFTAAANRPTLTFTAHTAAPYDVRGRTLRTGEVVVLAEVVSAWDVRFAAAAAPATTAVHGVPISPTVSVEAVTSAGVVDAAVQGTVSVRAFAGSGGGGSLGTPLGSAAIVGGDGAAFFGGVALFPLLAVVAPAAPLGPVTLEFTVNAPNHVRLNLRTLRMAVTVSAKGLHRLAFADTGFWPSAGAVRTVRLQAPLGPPAPTLRILDSAGRPDSSPAVSTPPGRLLVRATATALPAGTPVALAGAVATVSADGTAAFPSLRTDGYPASAAAAQGWSGGVRFTFSAEESAGGRSSPLDFASVSSGANPLEALAFSLRFASDPARSVVTAEGQTKEVVQGKTLGPVVVELLTLAGAVDAATTADAVVVDAFLHADATSTTPPPPPTLLATAPVAAGTGVATFAALTLPPGAATLAFRARASAAAAGAGAPPPLVQTRGVVLRTGVVTVVPLAAGLRFGPPPSAVSAAGATLAVRQGELVASITVELLRGDGAVDTATVGAVVEATSSSGRPPVGGTTRATVVNGRAIFAGLRFDQLPPVAAAAAATTLVFTLVTPGLPASGASVASGAVAVRGRPHHIGRLSPVPTGAVLGRVVELRIGVLDARGTLVDGAAFAPPPTLSVSGDAGVAATGTWPPGMSQTVRVTLDAPLKGGDVANVVVTPTHPTYAFDPPTLVVRLAVSAADNTVHHASFIDPYNVPTVVRVGDEVPVRVAFFDAAGQPAPNSDAAYAVATEDGGIGGSNGLVMLPQTLAARGGIQTVFLRFGGAAPRDAVVRFEGILPGKTFAPLTRQFRVLPGAAARLEVTVASGTVARPAPGPLPVVALGDAVVFEAALSDGEGNRVRTAGVVVTVAATVAAAAGGGGGTVRLVHVDATPTSAEGVARVTARFEGRLPTTTPATTAVAAAVVAAAPAAAGVAASAVLRAEVVAGRARQVTATLPAVLVAGVAGGGTVRVLDQYGNAARGADGVLVAATSPAVRTATTSRRGPAELAVWVTAAESPAGLPGPATVLFTPSLAGVAFDPASVAVAVVVKTLQHAVRFVSSSVVTPSATVGLPIEPVIGVVVVDSDGAPPGAAEPAAVASRRRTLRVRPSVVPAGAATLAGVDAAGALVGPGGVARFPTLRVATGPASAGQSVQIRFTVEVDGGGGGGVAATPAAVGQSVQTGALSLTTRAHSMRFATAASLFTRVGQPATARQHTPLAPAVRVEILDSAGDVDTAASSLPASAVVTALSSHDAADAAGSAFLVGRTAPVVRGVATFARLAFKTTPPLPHGAIIFRVEGLTAAGAVLAARRLTTGAVRVSESPATLSVPFDPALPATHRPLGYLVWDSVNAVPVDVLLASGLPATDVPPETQVRVSASVATRASGVPAPTLSGPRFTVYVAPTPGVVAAAAAPPSRATVAFSPAGLAYAFPGGGSVSKEFVMCAGPAAGAVFDAATPSDVAVAPAVAYVSLHLVDAAGRQLKDSWSPGCVAARARATDPAEGAAPVAVAAVASAPAGLVRLVAGGGGNGVLSVNGTLRVPLVATEAGRSGVLVTVTLENTATGAPATLSRAFSTVEAGPDRVEVTTRPQPVPVASGDAAALDLLFLTADGMPASAAAASAAATVLAVRVEEPAAAAGASVASHTQPEGAGRATASLRVTGPPRDVVVRVRAFAVRNGAADQPLPGAAAAVSLRVSHAAAAGGQTASQYYQVFPERAFASDGEFASAFAERATAVAADAPACPLAEVCRAIAAGNVELVPQQRWPVPPAGNALAPASLPAGTPRAYVFRLARVEATHVARVEAALRAGGAGVPSFPSLRHSAAEPPRFLGLLPGLPPPATPPPQTGVCAAIADAASCAAAAGGCRWDGLACVAATCGAQATEEACKAAAAAAACVWDTRTAPARCVDAATLSGGGSDGLWIKWGPALLIGAAVLLVCVCAAFVLRRCGSRAWWRGKEAQKKREEEEEAAKKAAAAQDQDAWRTGEDQHVGDPASLPPPPPPPPLHPQTSTPATQQQRQQRTRNYVNSSYGAGGPSPAAPQRQPLSPDAHLPEDERVRRALERVDSMIGTMDGRRGGGGVAATVAANHAPLTKQRSGGGARSGGAGSAAAVSGGGAGAANNDTQARTHAAAHYGGGGGGAVRTPSPRRGGGGEGVMAGAPSPGAYGGESPMSALTVDSDGLVVARQEDALGW